MSGGHAAGRQRPGYLRWGSIGLVAVGGVFGVAGREWASLAIPAVDEMPIAIPIVNIIGAFLLGCLYEAVSRRLPGDPRGGQLKLLLGTGFCGGFTSYSSLATDTAILLDKSRGDLALLYVAITILVGALATFAGIAVAARLNTRNQPTAQGSSR